jgi:hypothetical protein
LTGQKLDYYGSFPCGVTAVKILELVNPTVAEPGNMGEGIVRLGYLRSKAVQLARFFAGKRAGPSWEALGGPLPRAGASAGA